MKPRQTFKKWAIATMFFVGSCILLCCNEKVNMEPECKIDIPKYNPGADKGVIIKTKLGMDMISAYRNCPSPRPGEERFSHGLWHDIPSIQNFIDSFLPIFIERHQMEAPYAWKAGFVYGLSENKGTKRLTCCVLPILVDTSANKDRNGKVLDILDQAVREKYYPTSEEKDSAFIFDTGEMYP